MYITIAPHTSGIVFDPTKFSVYQEAIKFEDTWSSGAEYQPGDTIKVTPDTGLELRPTFNALGSLTNADIISKGNSFNTMPKIEIQTRSGVNADIWPVFKIQRIEDLQLIEPGQKIITVVDCVGKYNLPNK